MTEQSLALLESLAAAGLHAHRISSSCEVIREIEATDIPVILQELREHNWQRASLRVKSDIRTLRVGHHQLAQLLASGVEIVEASFLTGRSAASISSLKSDPAFAELVAFYRTQSGERQLDIYERQLTLGVLASEILQERLEESPEKFTNSELRALLDGASNSREASRLVASRRDGGPLVQINFVKSARNEGSEIEATAVVVQDAASVLQDGVQSDAREIEETVK